MKDLQENVHNIIGRRMPVHIHRHIADMENTPDGLTAVQIRTLPKNARIRIEMERDR